MKSTEQQARKLADHLAARRDAILENWRHLVKTDPGLTSASTLLRTEFYDHIPGVLDAFEHKLCARQSSAAAGAENEQTERAAEHGLHRWHHGYNQQDVMREWGHLHLCLVDELERYDQMHPDPKSGLMSFARRALAQLCSDGVTESTLRYAQMQQLEAAGRVRALEHALAQLKKLDRERAETWREAVHDLRGNFGIIKNVADVLNDDDTAETERAEFLPMLRKGVTSLHALLDNVLILSRLEAGHEHRDLRAFDAAVVLGELCETLKPLASDRGLWLRGEGPRSLPVEGDGIKVQRIAQNLILNALKYTQQGGVTVTLEEADAEGLGRWILSVQDTGPGFHAAPLAHALEASTCEAQAVEQTAGEANQPVSLAQPNSASAPQPTMRQPYQPSGEGIGLAIVKRLCELLDATLELETASGKGSTFRVVFPRHYDVAEGSLLP
jgi:signal transduction histidine kinase